MMQRCRFIATMLSRQYIRFHLCPGHHADDVTCVDLTPHMSLHRLRRSRTLARRC